MSARAFILLSILGTLAAACSEGGGPPDADQADAATADAGHPDAPAADATAADALPDAAVADAAERPISWQACNGGFSGACASVSVPLDWSDRSGRTIDLYVNKIVSAPRAHGQLWLLQGGPGASGADMAPLGVQLGASLDGFEIYTLDHRGVNQSTPLRCASDPTVVPSDAGVASDATADAGLDPGEAYAQAFAPCLSELAAEWGDGLQQFTTSNAARDLGYLIQRLRKPGQTAFVYGVSYGTYWAERYLQLFPDQPAGVILDSIVPPVGFALSSWDRNFDRGVSRWAAACGTDPICSAKLGQDPMTHLRMISSALRGGSCSGAPAALFEKLAILLEGQLTGPYALAALYRLERCAPADLPALSTLDGVIDSMQQAQASSINTLLHASIAYSELWERPAPTEAELTARAQAAVFQSGVEVEAKLQARWPRYPLDALVGLYPNSSVPLLIMNGTLDVQTPIDVVTTVQSHYSAPNQTFLTFPNANHGVILQSAMADGKTCGMTVVTTFIKSSTVTTDCVGRVLKPDFTGSMPNNQFMFGGQNIWENGLGVAAGAAAPDPELLRELREQARRR